MEEKTSQPAATDVAAQSAAADAAAQSAVAAAAADAAAQSAVADFEAAAAGQNAGASFPSADQNPICVRTLGAFAIGATAISAEELDDDVIDISGRARRIWLLIAYLIVHRDREIPASELIDMLWEDDDKRRDPLKTLQHNMSRARDALTRLGLPNARELIVARPGGYRWNPSRVTSVDLEIFQSLIAQAAATEDVDERIELHKRAVDIYRGDFLPGFEYENWVTPISAYGRSAYVNECLTLTRLLSGEENMTEIVAVCERALRFAPESEELNIRYIRALTASGCPEKAINVYENVSKLLSENLGVVPSPELQLAYEEARQAICGEAMPIESVRAILDEEAFDGKGMRCDWSSFLTLVRREARNASRANRSAVVLAVSYSNSSNNALDARRLETVLSQRLRSGDIYTRLNALQFLVLLPEAGEENVKMITDRLRSFFYQRFPKSDAYIECEWYTLEDPAN